MIDLKNLSEVAKLFYAELFYAEEFLPFIPHGAFSTASIIADYEHNAVFFKIDPGWSLCSYQNVQQERPKLFTKACPGKDGLIADITLNVLDRYRDSSDDPTTNLLVKLEASIYTCFRDGQANYQKNNKKGVRSCKMAQQYDYKKKYQQLRSRCSE